ncbi:neuroblast differentiation-associated protein AHNAK isoform X17 [Pteropus medius]|uniref:neuroblast differentiation-associated protein AHNAK isoform X17 n=1 Tax=Pteropus vampyrus TaxID=132908 RepID=UPI00196B3E02|nr:neuroblast differentiation-associated protein AHNAK isoform X17 [Pteropus giganteus]
MEKEEETTRELLLPNWQGSGSHGLTIAQRDDGVFVQEVMQNSPAARTGVVKEGDQIVGATIYFDNLQSGEVTQLLSTMGHHAVGLKLHRKGDRSPEPGQTWTHGVFSSHGSEVVLNTPRPSALECKDQKKPEKTTGQAQAPSVSAPNAGRHLPVGGSVCCRPLLLSVVSQTLEREAWACPQEFARPLPFFLMLLTLP